MYMRTPLEQPTQRASMRYVFLGRPHAAFPTKAVVRVMHVATSHAARFMRGEPLHDPFPPPGILRPNCPSHDSTLAS